MILGIEVLRPVHLPGVLDETAAQESPSPRNSQGPSVGGSPSAMTGGTACRRQEGGKTYVAPPRLQEQKLGTDLAGFALGDLVWVMTSLT